MSSDQLPPASPPDPPPVRPVEPDAADCCGEGCPRCIFDVYDEAMERYEAALAAWRKRHPEPGPGPRQTPGPAS
ncbi:MAG: oxidoreductase-like domain-containing protein [Lysobacter sp.]